MLRIPAPNGVAETATTLIDKDLSHPAFSKSPPILRLISLQLQRERDAAFDVVHAVQSADRESTEAKPKVIEHDKEAV